MRGLQQLGVPIGGSGGSGAAALLADGIYWQSGDASAKLPTEGQGWTLTTALDDVGANDTTTRVTSSSAIISILHCHAASTFAAGPWPLTAKWKGNWTDLAYEGDGTSWTTIVNSAAAPVAHGTYTDETVPGTYVGATIKGYHMRVLTEDDTSDGMMSISDSRPS